MGDMSEERAREINGVMVRFGTASHLGLAARAEDIEFLKGLSLLELAQAANVVEKLNANAESIDGTTTLSWTCDARMVAAIYAALHYPPSRNLTNPDATFVFRSGGVAVAMFLVEVDV